MEHIVTVKSIIKITHDVLKINTVKPAGYVFKPGQATHVSINRNGWKLKENPFTFTSIPSNNYLEFVIKTYPGHKGVTNELLGLEKNDELIIREVTGSLLYKGEGLFIAGGAGVTPFLSILRDLQHRNEVGQNRLLFANKTKVDIILEPELKAILGEHFVPVLSEEYVKGYAFGLVTKELLQAQKHLTEKPVYLCGPPPMITAIENHLSELGVKSNLIVKESY